MNTPLHREILDLLEEWAPQYLTDAELRLLGPRSAKASTRNVHRALSDLEKAGLIRKEPAEFSRHQKIRTQKIWRTQEARA